MHSSVVFLFGLSLFISPALSQSCSTLLTLGASTKNFTRCQPLPHQGASLAWTFFSTNRTLEIGFSGTLLSSSGWIGWGYNPEKAEMDGTSALIAFNNGSSPSVFLYSVTRATKGGAALVPTNSTSDLTLIKSAVNIEGNTKAVNLTAVLQLTNPKSNVFHIWNRGSSVTGTSPGQHPFDNENLQSSGRIDLAAGTATSSQIPRIHLKNAHGLLNGIGWGILLPIGVMSARYLRPFEWADPTWFYLHLSCQSLGYTLGVIGWAIGLKLGSDSPGVTYKKHRNIGISMFVFGTLQVLAIVLRPNKDHKYRLFWNIYHHSLGYMTILLAIINIFKGFDILNPAEGWKHAYIGIIIALGIIALVLEAITWFAYFHKKSRTPSVRIDNPSSNYKARNGHNPFAPQWDAENGA